MKTILILLGALTLSAGAQTGLDKPGSTSLEAPDRSLGRPTSIISNVRPALPEPEAVALPKPVLSDLRLANGQPMGRVVIERVDTDGLLIRADRPGANIVKYQWAMLQNPAEIKARLDKREQQAELARSGGLTKFARLTVSQVATSPFTLKETLIELTGFNKVEPQEVADGVYELTIRSDDYHGTLYARTDQRTAAMAEVSRTLYVKVLKPSENGTTVELVGNTGVRVVGSVIPAISWSK